MQTEKLEAVTLFGVALLIVAVATAIVVPSSNQYEISLYEAYPDFFWVLLVGAGLTGGLVILGSANSPGDRSWLLGLSVMLLTNALLLSMVLVRGYFMYGAADPMSHLGYVRNIVDQGAIGGNIYPPMHLLALAVADATGMDVTTVAMLLPVVFSAVYFAGMFYLLVFLFDSRVRILFGLPFVMLPVLGPAHLGFRPYDVSVMLVPVVLYLLFKSQRTPTPAVRATFVTVLVAFLLYHPLTALFSIPIFLSYFVLRYLPRVRDQYATPTSFVSLSVAVFAAWYSNYTGIIFRFRSTYETLFGGTQGEPPVGGYTETVDETSPELIDLARVLLFKYGIELLLFALGFAFLVVAILLLYRNTHVLTSYTTMFLGTMLIFSVGGLLFLFLDLQGPHTRPWQIAKIGAVVLSGQIFYVLWGAGNWFPDRLSLGNGLPFSVAVVLSVLIALSVLTVYPSPLESESNPQVTEMEMDGTEWYMQHDNTDYTLLERGISYHRFYHAHRGTGQPGTQITTTPDHFNYTEYEYLGQSYTDRNYLMINRKARIVYPEAFPKYPENWRFTPEDFDRLESDSTAVRLYDNGDYTQYLVDGIGG